MTAQGAWKYSQEYFAQAYSGAAVTFTKNDDFTPGGQPFKPVSSLIKRLPGVRRDSARVLCWSCLRCSLTTHRTGEFALR